MAESVENPIDSKKKMRYSKFKEKRKRFGFAKKNDFH